jgi:hypothetical protein
MAYVFGVRIKIPGSIEPGSNDFGLILQVSFVAVPVIEGDHC